jgi:prepilin peptidase CpaA
LLAGLPGLLDCILGLAIGLAMLFPIYFLGGTSAGDVKMLGVVGALLGANGAMIAGIATYLFGGVLGVLFIVWRLIEPILMMQIAQLVRLTGTSSPPLIRIVSRDTSRKAEIPYAPAIAFGTYYSLWHLGYFSKVMG